MVWRCILLVSMALPVAPLAGQDGRGIDPAYFEGRWSFIDEDCSAPTNWTLIAGGNFVSEDLVGIWTWQGGELILNLDDLAIDEESGERGGRFRMDGPVAFVDQDRFDFTIAPDVYQLKRCP